VLNEVGDDGNEGIWGGNDAPRRKSGIDWGLHVEPPSVIPRGRDGLLLIRLGSDPFSGILSVKVDDELDLNKDGYDKCTTSSKSPKSTTFSSEEGGDSRPDFDCLVLDRLLPLQMRK
jgi:hypothetical protein